MKTFIIVLAICILVVSCFAACGKQTAVVSSEESSSTVEDTSSETTSSNSETTAEVAEPTVINGHTLRRGLNLQAGALGMFGSDAYLTDEFTYQNIATRGFDHVRLPTDLRNYCNEDGSVIPEQMSLLETSIRFANENGLVVFLDFHDWYYLNTGREGDEVLFKAIWKSMAEYFKDYEHNDMLIFELINEPHDTEGSNLNLQVLEKLQCETADIIREINPDRTICFAVSDSNEPRVLDALESGYDFRDTKMMEYENIIIAVHIYHPAKWTLQGFDWYGTGNNVVYLDGFYLAELKLALKSTINFKKETGVPVIVGEFGWNTVNCREEDQITYLETMLKYLNKNAIPCTWWGYNNDKFALYKMGKGFKYQWNDLLVDMMMDY